MNNEILAINDRVSLRAPMLFMPIALVGIGLLYSLVGTALGGVAFPHQARGSLIMRDGKAVASELVAQPFASERYFHARPSAAGYDAMAVAGSNLARSNPDLRQRVQDAVAAVAAREGVPAHAVPSDMVTQSGGGLDPHLSPESARLQVARVARVRAVPEQAVLRLLEANTEQPQLGVLGKPRVNVVTLNLSLDAMR